jgi:hypothetical protein
LRIFLAFLAQLPDQVSVLTVTGTPGAPTQAVIETSPTTAAQLAQTLGPAGKISPELSLNML